MMKNDPFQALLAHPRPGLACYACGDKSETEALVVDVKHHPNGPARELLLSRMPDVPGVGGAAAFYGRHNGALLYSARGLLSAAGGMEEGLEIFKIGQWDSKTEESVEYWEDIDYNDDQMPYGRNDFISIAHHRGASTYVHWVIKGPRVGSVYWWASTDPPEAKRPPIAQTFSNFIDLISVEAIRFLNDISYSYSRFSDGVTDTQWIPVKYLPDSGVSTLNRPI